MHIFRIFLSVTDCREKLFEVVPEQHNATLYSNVIIR